MKWIHRKAQEVIFPPSGDDAECELPPSLHAWLTRGGGGGGGRTVDSVDFSRWGFRTDPCMHVRLGVD